MSGCPQAIFKKENGGQIQSRKLLTDSLWPRIYMEYFFPFSLDVQGFLPSLHPDTQPARHLTGCISFAAFLGSGLERAFHYKRRPPKVQKLSVRECCPRSIRAIYHAHQISCDHLQRPLPPQDQVHRCSSTVGRGGRVWSPHVRFQPVPPSSLTLSYT